MLSVGIWRFTPAMLGAYMRMALKHLPGFSPKIDPLGVMKQLNIYLSISDYPYKAVQGSSLPRSERQGLDGERIMRKKVRLLVVDDQPEFCDLVKEIVELSTHIFDITCEITNSSEKALELVKTWEPSIVLLDAHLSDSNSFEMLEDIKDIQATVVVTSAEMSQEIEDAARKGGASGYVCKSTNLEEVERLVHELATMAATDGQIH